MKALYKYPQRRFPYADLLRGERAGARKLDPEYELIDTGIFDDDAYFDVCVEYAKAAPEDILMRITVDQPRTRSRRRIACCRRCGFATRGRGGRGVKPSLRRRTPAQIATFASSSPITPTLGDVSALLRGRRANCSSPRTRRTTNALFGVAQRDAVRQGRHRLASSCTASAGAVNPSGIGTKAAARYVLDVAPGETRAIRLRLTGGDTASAPFAGFDDVVRATHRRGRRVLCAASTPYPAGDDERAIQRHAFAGHACGASNSTTTSCATGSRAIRCMPPPPPQRWTGATTTGITSTATTFSRCPIRGSIRGSRRGISPFIASCFALIDPDFAKRQLLAAHARMVHAPERRSCPPTSGHSATSTRRCMAWAAYRVFQIETQDDRARATALPRARLSEAAAELHLVGQPQGRRTGTTSFKAVSSGSTTSGSSTAARSCRPAVVSTIRRHELDGRLLRSTCWRSRSSSRQNFRSYEDIASKFFEHFLYIADAMNKIGGDGTGSGTKTDGFYYDYAPRRAASAFRCRSARSSA